MIDSILGLQFGDEGKGKIVDFITPNYDIVARFQGGSNAGHSILFDDKKYVLHLIPSGIFRDNCINLIGSGVVVDPISLVEEIKNIEKIGIDVKSKLKISKKAHLILPTHKLLDKVLELSKGENKIGSTLKGIGPTYTDKISRNGIRIGDIFIDLKEKYENLKEKHLSLIPKDLLDSIDDKIWFESIEYLKNYDIIDCEYYINKSLKEGKRILAEGAQGSLLDIDYGTYPFVTSSNTTISGVISGLGISPHSIGNIIGIFKAYTTRVGSGPFPTELNDEIGEKIRDIGNEWGSTTGRSRRCGWLDLPALKYSIMLNGITELNLMKLDVLNTFDTIKVCTGYELDGKIYQDKIPFNILNVKPIYKEFKGWNKDISYCKYFDELPIETKDYINYIIKETGININIISIGPDREKTIKL